MPRARLAGGQELEWVDDWADCPLHDLLFENAHTRIYRARFEAGRGCETAFHRHKEDTVYACISAEGPGGRVLNTEVLLDEAHAPVGLAPPAPVSFTPGLCFCHLNRSRHRVHRIQTAAANTGTLCFIGAEVLAPPPAAAAVALGPHPCYSAEAANHPRARVYRVSVPPRGATGPVPWGFCGVVMVLAGAAPRLGGGLADRDAAPGAAWWFEGPLVAEISNDSADAAAELLVVEWL